MDGTVIPLDRRRERAREIADFGKAVRGNRSIVLAYVTGRHLALALQGIKEHRLPLPQILVCDVGTSVYMREGTRWVPDAAYRRTMKTCLGGHSGDEIEQALEGTRELTLQEAAKQAEFKRSYYLPLHADPQKVHARVKRRLSRRGIRANLVYSVDGRNRVGLLDVLPAKVAKDFSLHYLQRKLRVPASRVVYAGDSGNDLQAFTSGYNAIVVSNTPDRVKELLRTRMARKQGLAETIFFARHRYVKGVLEGARHFGAVET
jgi:HAD superfamily hydrolase (TIGR01484 family)